MKKTIFSALFSILIFSLSTVGQTDRNSSSRLDSLSVQLKRQTEDLTRRADADLRRGSSNSRAEIETVFLARQLDASAELFQQMVRDNLRENELRDAAAILSDLAGRAPNYGSNNQQWRNAQNAINDITRELSNSRGGGGFGNNDGYGGGIGRGGGRGIGQSQGSATWRGIVDKEVQLVIRGRYIQTKTISGRAYAAGNFNFTAALPTQDVSIEVDKKSGRGDVRVIQQPSRDNGYTAIVLITDNDGGAQQYQVDIYWR